MKALVSTIIAICFGWMMNYFVQPVWALDFLGGYFLVAVSIFVAAILYGLLSENEIGSMLGVLTAVLPMAVVSVVALCTSWSLFHAERHYTLLGKEATAELTSSLPPLALDRAPLVSEDMAARSAEKQLAEIPTLGSQVELGPLIKQVVKGELVWVAFLHHRGFFKWFNEGSTPGYVVVSAHDPTKVELVTKLDGKPLQLRYLTSAYLGDDAARRVYTTGNRSVSLGGMHAELDDEGRPFYVVPLIKHTIGFDGDEVDAVATLDVQTGEVRRYSLADAPAWIDQLYPSSILEDQVKSRGELVKGWFNPSDEARFRISAVDLVYGQNGHAAYYVGLTSVGRDSGIIGFMLIDSRTKAVLRYQLAGATESTAEAAAEGVLPEKKYRATSPLPFMVNNEPTYAMALRDGTGIPRAYALVSIRNYQVVAVADTLQATLRQYQAKLSQDRTAVTSDSVVTDKKVVGVVSRVSQDIRNGTSAYYLMVQGEPSHIFVGNTDTSEELVLTKVGDKVELHFPEGSSRVSSLTGFDNLSITNKANEAVAE